MVATAVDNHMIGRIGGQILKYLYYLRGRHGIFRTILESHQRPVIIQQNETAPSLSIQSLYLFQQIRRKQLPRQVLVLVYHVFPFFHEVGRPFVDGLDGKYGLHLADTFCLLLVWHLQRRINGIRNLVRIIGVNLNGIG